ncbi:MFS transporter [Derxia lacustris]|uniref:MFS transporter n=1 Tax=Derxia lacustris TaxID=764842 RepID=UPI0015936B68|nr:MFS transporter [Derxia lacustris]
MASVAPARVAPRWLFGLIGVFAFINVYSIQSVLPDLMRAFDASAPAVGATVGATVMAVALLSPLTGMVSDALGRKAFVVASMLAVALPTIAIGFAQTLPQVVALRFVEGLFIPGITVVIVAYIGEELAPGRMAAAMGTYVAGCVLGGFAGRFLTGQIAEWSQWRTAFVVLGGLNALGGLVVARLLPASRRFVARRELGAAWRGLLGHARNARLMAACAVGFCVLLCQVGVFTYINLLLAGPPWGFGPAALANVFTIYLLGFMAAPLTNRLIGPLGYRGTLVLALGGGAVGALLTLLPSFAAVLAGLALASTATFVAQTVAISFVAANVREGRSLASGLYNAVYYAGGSVGAVLGGVLWRHFGWPGVIAMVLCAQLGGCALAWRRWAPPRAG